MRAALLLVLLASDPGAPSTSAAAAPADPQVAPTAPAVPTPPPVPAATLLRAASAVEPAQRLPLAPGAESVVDPRATFEIDLAARLPDARIVLVDARDDLVPATSARELSVATRLTLTPAAPLVPGSRYALRVDGASGRVLRDEVGRAFAPLTLPILAAGTPPTPEQKRPARSKRRRR